MISMTIDRESLALPDLEIGGECKGLGYWLGIETTRPEFQPRYDYAPDSAWIPGKQLLGVVKDAGVLSGTIFIRANSSANLEYRKLEFEDALWQFSFDLTFNDGAPRTYKADPSIPQWGSIIPGHDKIFVAKGAFSIPINP